MSRAHRPVVGAIKAVAAEVIRVVRRQIFRHLDRFRHIAAHEGVISVNALQRHIAPVVGPVEIMAFHLVFDRQAEKPLHRGARAGDDRLRKLVVLEHQIARPGKRIAEGPAHRLAVFQAGGINPAEIHHMGFCG